MPLVVGHIVECEPVAGKSNLRECKVDIGPEVVTIVTNAPNVRLDTHTVVALIGSVIESGGESLIVERKNIGGVYSHGMICDSQMCGWIGGAVGIAVQVPISLLPGSPAPASKPRMGGVESVVIEHQLTDKERKAKEKADRKALAATKKEARKAKKAADGSVADSVVDEKEADEAIHEEIENISIIEDNSI